MQQYNKIKVQDRVLLQMSIPDQLIRGFTEPGIYESL